MKLIMVILLILLPACDEKSTGADTCGDSILDPGESCDSANLNDETCQTLGFHGGALVCTGECQFDTAPCQVFGRCGDGILQEAETCEGENFGGATCFSLEQLPGGDLQCDENCQVDTSGCNNCGDGVLQTGEGESCDDQEMNGTQCTDLGFYGGELGCSDSCRFVTDLCEGFCGDGIIQEGDESCDGTNLGSATCYEGGFFRGESVLCDGTCQFDPQSPDCVSAVTISAGSDHYCVVDSLQKAWCWGNGAYGKLGTGTTVSKTVPAAVNTDTLFTMISAGYSHTCAIDTVGNGWCWGENIYGQLGIGDSTADGVTPMDMSPMAGATFRELQVGSQMSCGIDTQSRVWCWGDNDRGALGVEGLPGTNNVPILTDMDSSVVCHGLSRIAYQSVCVSSQGNDTIWCWGENAYWQLGRPNAAEGGADFYALPGPIFYPPGTMSVPHFEASATGLTHTCALDSNAQPHCWGSDANGELGNGSLDFTDTPTPVTTGHIAAGAPFSQMVSGDRFSCMLDSAGGAWCWGYNASGQLGNNSTVHSDIPVAVTMTDVRGGAFVMLAAASSSVCGIDTLGSVYCWGSGADGQLGNNSVNNSLIPVRVQAVQE